MNAELKIFWDSLSPLAESVDARLDKWLPQSTAEPTRLHEAMRYSMFAGGKRVRPIIMMLACRAVGGQDEAAMPPACATECVHSYSLIHDDLPAMDDDDYRRGRLSCHKAFDEATAILAGDALLTFAFEIVALHSANEKLAAAFTRELAVSAGWSGMVGGQMADLQAEGSAPGEASLNFVHARKTGALIRAAVRCGAIAGGADKRALDALTEYAENVGLAFQIADDILDATATSQQLGKTAGKDLDAKKLTFIAVYGLGRSREEGRRVVAQAKVALEPFGDSAKPLAMLADFIIARTS